MTTGYSPPQGDPPDEFESPETERSRSADDRRHSGIREHISNYANSGNIGPSYQTPSAALASVVRPIAKSRPMSYGKRGSSSIGGSGMSAVHENRDVRGRGSNDSKSSGSHNRVGQAVRGQEAVRGQDALRGQEALRDLPHAALPSQSVFGNPMAAAMISHPACPESPESGDTTGNSTSTTSTARKEALAMKVKEHASKAKEYKRIEDLKEEQTLKLKESESVERATGSELATLELEMLALQDGGSVCSRSHFDIALAVSTELVASKGLAEAGAISHRAMTELGRESKCSPENQVAMISQQAAIQTYQSDGTLAIEDKTIQPTPNIWANTHTRHPLEVLGGLMANH
jgi:hypothetical protein